MSKYKPYPQYKDVGVEWLREVPKHWKMTKLKFVGKAIIGLTYSPNEVTCENNGILVLRSSNVQNKKIAFDDNVYVNTKIPTHLLTQRGDILICSRNGSRSLIGKNALIDENSENLAFGAFMTIFRTIYCKYIFWVLNSSIFEFQSGTFLTATINQLTTGNLNNFDVPFTSYEEQITISNFLDNVTCKIDTLIQKQQNLIELLKEKRQALISHAVTKGLNPHVKMKDSGVEWLGEVPEHWEVKRLKYNLVLQINKVTIDEHEVIALENIESKTGKYMPTESSYQGEDVEFKKGDILFGKLRPYLAKVYKCDSSGVAFGDLLTFRPNPYFDSSFAFYAMLSEEFIKIVDSSTYGAKMPRASSAFINEMFLATPPLDEQSNIAKSLDSITYTIDTLISKAQKAIELLKERRTALISAAVTGKIDVRSLHE